MATEITGQNGAVIRQSTPIPTTGCPKHSTPSKKQQLALALKACNKKEEGQTPSLRQGRAEEVRRESSEELDNTHRKKK